MNTPSPASNPIPTREEFKRQVRGVWIRCGISAVVVGAVTSATAVTLALKGYSFEEILRVSTIVFQILTITAFLGVVFPAAISSLLNMSLSVEMGRQALEKTTSGVDRIEKEIGTGGSLRELISVLKDIRDQNRPKPLPARRRPEKEGDETNRFDTVGEIAHVDGSSHGDDGGK